MKKIAVIGGGAAGMMAAISCDGAEVTLFEKNNKPGKKLLITGKGRCNITNNCDVNTLISNIISNPSFLYSAFNRFGTQETMDFFEDNGVALKTERGNRVFPVSDIAEEVVNALKRAATVKGVKISNNNKVVQVQTKNNVASALKQENGQTQSFDAVIIATGGASYPLTGSTGDGYRFAKELGHTVTNLKPSLVPIVTREKWCTQLMGLTLKNITLTLINKKTDLTEYEELGEMLFTHFGVSGPLVLSASSHMSQDPCDYIIKLDLKPALDTEKLDKRILQDFSQNINKDYLNSLSKLLPAKMIPVMVELSGIDAQKKVNSITKEERLRLCALIKELTITPKSFRPLEEAIVTSGGVSTKEINAKTMESKIIKNLYFAGEVIDVDAYTGGFNLQIAFSTGYTAGFFAGKE